MADDVVIEVEEEEVGAAPATPGVVVVDEEAGDDVPKLPKAAALQPDGSVVLTLAQPVELVFRNPRTGAERPERYATLHMHRLNGESMRAVYAAQGADVPLVAIARSLRLHQGKVNAIHDRMDGADAMNAGRVVDYFLGSGRTTGR